MAPQICEEFRKFWSPTRYEQGVPNKEASLHLLTYLEENVGGIRLHPDTEVTFSAFRSTHIIRLSEQLRARKSTSGGRGEGEGTSGAFSLKVRKHAERRFNFKRLKKGIVCISTIMPSDAHSATWLIFPMTLTSACRTHTHTHTLRNPKSVFTLFTGMNKSLPAPDCAASARPNSRSSAIPNICSAEVFGGGRSEPLG